MLRKVLIPVAVLAVAIVAGAGAKTVTVTITKNGYVPSSLTIAEGDVVQFTNSDAVVHQIAFKTTTGVTCSASPLVVQPGASATCTFASAGSFSYSDPNVKGGTFRGTVAVTAAPQTLSIVANKTLVIYSANVELSGVLSTKTVGDNVDVLAQQCGASSATKLTTVPTTTGGVYATSVKPLMNTSYTAKTKAASSPSITVRVRPSLRLTKVAAHRYTLRVSGGSSFAGKYASFQRYSAALGHWVAVRAVLLKASATGVAPTVVSLASIRSTLHSGLRIRATLPQAQAGSCYAPGTSNTILS